MSSAGPPTPPREKAQRSGSGIWISKSQQQGTAERLLGEFGERHREVYGAPYLPRSRKRDLAELELLVRTYGEGAGTILRRFWEARTYALEREAGETRRDPRRFIARYLPAVRSLRRIVPLLLRREPDLFRTDPAEGKPSIERGGKTESP